MTISQVKKQFEEMAAYLNRDAVGLSKLRALKDAVNVIRNKLSTAEEAEQRAMQVRDIAVTESAKLKTEAIEHRRENQRLQQKVDNLERELAAYTSTRADDNTEDDVSLPKKSRQFAATIKELRKHIKHCQLAAMRGDRVPVVNKKDIAKGWSRQDIWNLGAAVAVLSAFKGEVVLLSDELVRDLGDDRSKGDVLGWLKKHINPIVQTPFDDVCAGMIEPPPYAMALGFKP